MPRTARIKSIDSIYHIMCRSISEVKLFNGKKDKEYYLKLLKDYKNVFDFKVYAYCLMDNHCHLIIDANGADISKILHGINQKYAHYYNKKYDRHGHLFQDRFKSIIVDDERYLLTLSGYIHANPLSIKQYKRNVENYVYSSLGIYLGIHEDKHELIDKEFIMSQFSNKEVNAKKLYLEFIRQCTKDNIRDEIEFENEGTMYVSERKILAREFEVEKIIQFIVEKLNVEEQDLRMKNSRKATKQRAIFVLLMRCFCNYKIKNICSVIGNITQSRVSSLCTYAMSLMRENEYSRIIQEFIGQQVTA